MKERPKKARRPRAAPAGGRLPAGGKVPAGGRLPAGGKVPAGGKMPVDNKMPDEPVLVLREPEDELGAVLREAQFLLVKHPIAALSLFRAFVEEGRAFAATEEGAAWRRRLAGSELLRRARVVWEIGTLNLLQEQAPTVLPSRLLDAVLAAADVADLEPTLARLFGGAEADG